MFCYLLTYLLTPWSRVLLEKLTGSAASQEIPRIFMFFYGVKCTYLDLYYFTMIAGGERGSTSLKTIIARIQKIINTVPRKKRQQPANEHIKAALRCIR